MKIKIIFLFSLILFFLANFYSLTLPVDPFTQSKINFSKFDGSTSYFGRLNLWRLLVQNNDWSASATIESGLNQTEIQKYKESHQPQSLAQKITELENNPNKNTDDYLELAKYQSLLLLSQEAIDSIKKAHQLDPIRSDVDKLFYSVTQ